VNLFDNLRAMAAIALLERDSELSVIREALAAARGADGRWVFIEGPAGIGKTALLGAARALARAHGYRVLTGAGGELEREFPYGVIRQLFSTTLAHHPRAGELLAGAAAFARPVLALKPDRQASLTGGDSHLLEALHGLYWLVVNLAAESPVLVAVDDVHWCDGASLRFLLYLRRRLEGLPIVIVGTSRVGEPGADEHLLGLLGANGGPGILRPSSLSLAAVTQLLQVGLSEEPDSAFVAAVHAATAGNPFLLKELIAALLDREMHPTAESAARIGELGTQGVSRAIVHRLATLGDGAIALAHAIAVFGGSSELSHAAALAGQDEEVAAQVVEALVRAQILRNDRRLSFVHPLVRAAIYFDIPGPTRTRAHAHAARILAAAGSGPDAVAAHLLETDPAADDAVVRRLRAAAQLAAGQGAMDVAAAYLRRAIAEPPAATERAMVLRELGAAELAAGRPDAAADRLAQAALEADNLDGRVSIVLMRRHALVLADRIGEAVAVVDQVGQEVTDSRLADLMEAGAIGAGQLDFDFVPKIEARISALLARASTPALQEPLAIAVGACASVFANRPRAEVVALTERAISAMQEVRAESDYSFEGQLAIALYLSEQYQRLFELASRWLENARRSGWLPRFISMATIRSSCAYRVGALADAEADARDALEVARLYGHHFWLPGAVAALINPLIEHGRLDEAEAVLTDTRVEEIHGKSHAFCWAAMFLPARGRLRLAQGRLHKGLEDLLACGERFESAANRSPSLWAWRSEAALTLVALGERGRASELAREELRLARAAGNSRAVGLALRAVGLVVGGSEGLTMLQAAIVELASSGAVLEHSRALVDLGSALRRSGERASARVPLRAGLELAVRSGADVIAARARDELLATGATLRRDRLTGPDALTPSEKRIARMAADGLTNPEIAQALFLTRRTVETHLTHAYQKLGIGSRDDLAGALGAAPPNLA
jgi:DNA-binding CsgD family transcriptional regulator